MTQAPRSLTVPRSIQEKPGRRGSVGALLSAHPLTKACRRGEEMDAQPVIHADEGQLLNNEAATQRQEKKAWRAALTSSSARKRYLQRGPGHPADGQRAVGAGTEQTTARGIFAPSASSQPSASSGSPALQLQTSH
ncbi:hypothetical protein NDU88_004740 [Pleurodeles waltl]|uniref:Uncharacterized protein n=1 Tax=Pleurodeles waltl TaxID=8319 RepID=A0AAV7RK46_PLEWA|nr:hypothetical protein NDU88_004740 [Pleurodeles waltl]